MKTQASKTSANLHRNESRSIRPDADTSPDYRDAAAREHLINEHYEWITRSCKQMMKNDADGLDAAQEVAIRIDRSLRNFEGRSSVRTWLSRIVHNECVDQMRRNQRKRLTPVMEAQLFIHQTVTQDSPTATQEWPAAVHEALHALPAMYREVLHLRFFGDLPIAEIAALLNLSLSATKMRLYRALNTFKAAYTPPNDDLISREDGSCLP